MKSIFYMRPHLRLFFVLVLILISGSGLVAQTDDSLIFRDDFDRVEFGGFWQADANWSLVNGSAFNFIDGNGGNLKTTTGYSQPSYIIETSARGFVNDRYRDYRIIFGEADPDIDEQYQLEYTEYSGARLTLSKSADDIFSPRVVLDQIAIYPAFNFSQWYTFKIARYQSGLIQVFVDEGSGYGSIPVLEAIDLTYTELGHVGFQINTETSAREFYVDWISVSKPGVEKSATREKPAEDDLIRQVSAQSGKSYNVAKLTPGVKQLIDRDYTITSIPEYLDGASFIQASNDDKLNTAENFLTFFLKGYSILYIGYDSRSEAIPEWLKSWYKTGDRIVTSDDKAGYLDVYSKLITATGDLYPYPTILGGNLAGQALGAKTNYLVAAVKWPGSLTFQAENALLSGAVVAKNHLQYNGTGFADFKNPTDDYIEWTVQIDVPGTYDLGVRFSNAIPGTRFLQLAFDGINNQIVDFETNSTSWSTWSTRGQIQQFLTAGVHKIRLTATGTSGPNIDELSLFYLSDSPIPVTSAPTTLSGSRLQSKEIHSSVPDYYVKAYPNPFLQHANIYFKLKVKTQVNLSIYTLQGQQIKMLMSGTREAGSYQATFNAEKFAKGIYLYRLQIGNEIKTGKLVKE